MLQAIRSKAESYIVKALFVLLTATFAIWGIGDIFRNWGTDTSVAKVGSQEISSEQVGQEARAEMDQLRRILGNSIDTNKAEQLGILNSALERIVGGTLLDLETQRLGLKVGDEAVRQAIIDNPDFKSPQGGFDRTRYRELLAANHLSEPQYEESVREQLIRNQLTDAVTGAMSAPATMVNALYRAQAERRTADVATLKPSAVAPPPMPSEDKLAAYYNAHKNAFRVPELRAFTVATLTLNDIASTISVSPDKLKAEYKSRKDEFQAPAEREIKQMLLPDKATAEKAKAELDSGKGFAVVAKLLAKAGAASTDLGWVKRNDLPSKLADAAFSLPKDKASKPIQTSFGWHVLMVTSIKPAQTKTLASVKDQLTKSIQRDEAANVIADTANHIDDALSGGASFAAVVQKFGLKTKAIAAIDAQGQGLDGKPVSLPQPSKPILKAAFSSRAGETSTLGNLGDDGYFLVHVNKVSPAHVRPLKEARKAVIAAWQAQQKKEALEKLAAAMVAQVNKGKSLQEVAAAHHLKVVTTQPIARTSDEPTVPPALVAALFDAKQKSAVSAPAGDDVVVAQLKSIEAADPAKDKAGVKQLKEQLSGEMKNDMMNAFDQSLRANFPVVINKTNLDRVL